MMPLYRLLLHLYPASFRNEYAGEMCAVFARRLRDASAVGVPALWIGVFFEVFFNAVLVHADVLRQDLRYTARGLRRTPGFAATAVLVVALGVGANTAAFSLADQVLLRPLPFPQSGRLVKLWQTVPGYSRLELSPANYADWKKMSHSFAAMGAYNRNAANLVSQGEPERVDIATVDGDVLPTLGVQPLLGRIFTAVEDREGASGTLLLSYGLWQRRFGGDSNILGRELLLNDERYTVIGVMPRAFYFPSRDTQLWTPIRLKAENYVDRNDNWIEAVGRLRPGVTLAQASSDMAVITAQLEGQYPKEDEKTGARVYLLRDDVSPQSRLLLYALAGAALCVLLIACTNLANLLLVRALVREKERAAGAPTDHREPGAGAARRRARGGGRRFHRAAVGALDSQHPARGASLGVRLARADLRRPADRAHRHGLRRGARLAGLPEGRFDRAPRRRARRQRQKGAAPLGAGDGRSHGLGGAAGLHRPAAARTVEVAGK
jgi:putative ABC transport system permease protein